VAPPRGALHLKEDEAKVCYPVAVDDQFAVGVGDIRHALVTDQAIAVGGDQGVQPRSNALAPERAV
jgi:hypothetical protein